MAMKVGVIVVSYDSERDLPACLDALLAAESVTRIVIVDNASSDGSCSVAGSIRDDRVRLLALETNTGFAGGCNRGWAALDGDVEIVASVNPDVVVGPDCLALAAAELDAHGELGAVAPRLMRPDGVTVDSVGQVLDRRNLEVRDRGYGGVLTPELTAKRPVLAACGALAVYRRSALDVVAEGAGPWAEHYFCFWEDLELGWRLHNGGFAATSLPDAVAVHRRGAGAEKGPGPLRWRRPIELEACVIGNRWMTMIRHLHALDLIPRLPLLLGWDVTVTGLGVARRPSLAAAVARRWPLLRGELRARGDRPRRRLRELPW